MLKRNNLKRISGIACIVGYLVFSNLFVFGGKYIFSIEGNQVLLNDTEIKIIGLRTSNALISDATTQQLIDNLEVFKSYGINTVSVYFMGSRFGDIKGYLPDSSPDPIYVSRMSKIIEAADERGMIVLVGCLYWSTSKAKEDLLHWTETDAVKAIANTVKWLSENNYRNVFVDPDNEGMAWQENKWRIEKYIDAAHAVDSEIMVANNAKYNVPNADLNIHFGPREPEKPYIDSEATPQTESGGYWGIYSKEEGYYNYIRIGVYSDSTKTYQLNQTKSQLEKHNGYMLASTWLQAGEGENIGGPFMKPGGYSNVVNINLNVKKLHQDAGIKWWLEFVKSNNGPWIPPASPQ
jgi:hypothetical protein